MQPIRNADAPSRNGFPLCSDETAAISAVATGISHPERGWSMTDPTATAEVAVRLRGVRKEFGDMVAVDGVDLDVRDGEFMTLLGPSGSGKTTVLRMIAGFELPSGGTVELAGVDVTRRPPFERDVNTVFQDYALFPHMSVQ